MNSASFHAVLMQHLLDILYNAVLMPSSYGFVWLSLLCMIFSNLKSLLPSLERASSCDADEWCYGCFVTFPTVSSGCVGSLFWLAVGVCVGVCACLAAQ